MFCTAFLCELLPTDHKVSKTTWVVMFGVGLGYCPHTLFLTTVFLWGGQLVVLCLFAVGKRGVKIGHLLSWPPLPVLGNTLKLHYKKCNHPGLVSGLNNYPVCETAVIMAVDIAMHKLSFILSSMAVGIFCAGNNSCLALCVHLVAHTG